MRTIRTLPFFTPEESDVEWGKWRVNGEEVDSFEELMKSWPPAPTVEFSIGAQLKSSFREHAHMANEDFYGLAIELYCPGTRFREVRFARAFRNQRDSFQCSLIVDASQIAGEAELTATIFGPGFVSNDESIPAIPSARLASTMRRIALRGASEVLPTREVDNLTVPWEIRTSFQELRDRYQHHLTPLLNSKEKNLIKGLKSGDKYLRWLLVSDVIRTSIQAASSLASDDLSEVDEEAERFPESLIASVNDYANRMNGWTASELLRLYRDPTQYVEVERRIKELGYKYV
ncbi:MAG: hypothetical protein QM234_09620 [Acidobacteriota bacterium]|nr:hypothetical protein [Acidobacteriota bacterium]